jgi:hypothetical protein
MQQLEADIPGKVTEGACTFCSGTLGAAMVYLRQHRRFVAIIVEAKFQSGMNERKRFACVSSVMRIFFAFPAFMF